MSLGHATYERLTAELERLEHTEIPEARDAVSLAQGAGDIAENPDVALCLVEVARLESRARYIKGLLVSGVRGEGHNDGVVAPGMVVEIEFAGEESETYYLGNLEERHEQYETMTPTSHVGSALLGRRAGEVIEVGTASGLVVVRVIDVRCE